MAKENMQLLLQPAPFLRDGVTTPRLMFDVLIALVPVAASALWYFGLSALFVMIVGIGSAVATEAAFGRSKASLKDGSAVLTGLIFALTLPPGIPLWMAAIGGVVAVSLGKTVWGGLGSNLFNPALVGRAFLQAAFPSAMTTWVAPGSVRDFFRLQSGTLGAPLMHASVDAVTTATPLARMKFEQQATALVALAVGNTAGSLGETSALLVAVGGIYLLARRAADWRIPVSILLSVAALSAVFYGIDPTRYPTPWMMMLSGGLMFGTMFMATDPVTSPLAPRAAWIFGGGIGVLVVLIRLFGGLPEGVMYAILLMNSATPLIERAGRPRPFGRKKA